MRFRLPGMPARRMALGLSGHVAPLLLFVVVGIVLGPEALGIIGIDALAQLDPVISIALAVLGIFIGSGYATARGRVRLSWVVGASIEALVTLAAVVGAMYFLLNRWSLPAPVDPLAAACVLGMCSAASAAVLVRGAESPDVLTAAHLADLDDLPVVVLGTLAVPLLAGVPSPAAATILALAGGLTIGAAGALLFGRSHGAAERGVFVIGTVVLLGGAAAYASTSPLVTGGVAGLLWARAGGSAASLADDDLRKLQHPLVALLLIIAGASIQLTPALWWIAAPLVLFRLTGKLLGSLASAYLLRLPAGLLAAILAPPGVLGIALALNIQQVLPSGDTLLVSAVTVATVISELLAVVLVPAENLA